MGTVESTNAPTYHRASEEDVLIQAHIAEAGGGGGRADGGRNDPDGGCCVAGVPAGAR